MNYTPYTSADNAPPTNTELCHLMGRLSIRIITPMIDVRAPVMGVSAKAMKASSVQTIRCPYGDAVKLVMEFKANVRNNGEYVYVWTLESIAL